MGRAVPAPPMDSDVKPGPYDSTGHLTPSPILCRSLTVLTCRHVNHISLFLPHRDCGARLTRKCVIIYCYFC